MRGACRLSLYLSDRPDILPKPLRIMIEINDSARSGVVTVSGAGEIEISHGFFNEIFYAAVFLLIIKGPVFKNHILSFRDIGMSI